MLLGDSAMGLPLEKGLGFGWRAANALVQCLSRCASLREALLIYQARFEVLAAEAVHLVEEDFARYKQLVKSGSTARTLVNTVTLGLAPVFATSAKKSYRSAPVDVEYSCARCGKSYRLDRNTGCLHADRWHSQYGDCGVRCALKLGSSRLGRQHWGCCGSADHADNCCSLTKHTPK